MGIGTETQFDSAALRRISGSFPTGVVTTLDGRPRGMTANAFASVSLDPTRLPCIGQGAARFPVFAQCRSFAVNVLREGQPHVSSLFASKPTMKFAARRAALLGLSRQRYAEAPPRRCHP
jgi:flavin reductase (DIM6/NTAB) family NADH-FMN oxidoreductase RutF